MQTTPAKSGAAVPSPHLEVIAHFAGVKHSAMNSEVEDSSDEDYNRGPSPSSSEGGPSQGSDGGSSSGRGSRSGRGSGSASSGQGALGSLAEGAPGRGRAMPLRGRAPAIQPRRRQGRPSTRLLTADQRAARRLVGRIETFLE